MGIIGFIIIGFLAGLIARALMPGRQGMGLLATTLLGIAGSFVGGLIGSLFSRRPIFDLHPSGIIMSVLGAMLVLFIMGYAGRGRRVHV
jgi:uncharacterized membrane protein YeaQ/YmgE (transglycosylase-associated protein family)